MQFYFLLHIHTQVLGNVNELTQKKTVHHFQLAHCSYSGSCVKTAVNLLTFFDSFLGLTCRCKDVNGIPNLVALEFIDCLSFRAPTAFSSDSSGHAARLLLCFYLDTI